MKFRIYGEVKDTRTGQALTGAIVKLYLNKKELQQCKSAKNGFYELIAEIDDSRIESGQQLLITFELEGYQRQKNLVLLTEGSFNLDTKLEAVPLPPPQKPFNWLPVIIAGGAVLVLLVVGVILFLILRPKMPKIISFSVDPNAIETGQSATLSWETTNAVNVQISPDVGDVDESGSRIISPSQTTTYKLIAKNKKGKEIKSEAKILISHSKSVEYKNLALEAGSKASQSATAYGGVPERAIDGNPDGNYSHNSVTHTDNRPDSFWQVRLPKPAKIKEIVIWNRSDCCGDRLSNLRVSVLDKSREEVWGKNFRGPVKQGGSELFEFDTPVRGRFVRVQIQGKNKEGNGYLSLAEVQVFGIFTEYRNLALEAGSKASQSATAYGGVPERAIDGNPDGNYSHNSVTHTDNRPDSFWQLRLPKPAKIEEIVIWNRSDCCGDRLSNLRVSVLDESIEEVWGKNFRGPVKQGGSELFVPDTPVRGRFVRVQIQGKNKEGNGYLSLAEVQVFGIFTE